MVPEHCAQCGTERFWESDRFCTACGAPFAEGLRSLEPAPYARRFLADVFDISPVLVFMYASASGGSLWWAIAGFAWYCLNASEIPFSNGKRMLGLRLTRTDGRPLASPGGLARKFLRALAMFVLSPLLVTWWPLPFNAERQAIHDFVAGTRVSWIRAADARDR